MTKFNHKTAFAPVDLNVDWPVHVSGLYRQPDHPIAFLHYHEFFEIGLCYEGSGIFIIGDTVYPYNAGAVIFIPPFLKHLAQSLPGTQSVWRFATIHFELLKKQEALLMNLPHGFGNEDLLGGLIEKEKDTNLYSLMSVLLENLVSQGELFKRRFSLHFIDFLLLWSQHFKSTNQTKSLREGEYERVQKAIEKICQNYSESLSVVDLANLCNLSVAQFRRVFEKALGKSPQEYINEVRLEMAMLSLKNTKKSILEISLACGFTTLSSFNRLFQKHYKCSPKQIRNNL